MNLYHPYTIFHLGDTALIIDFGDQIDAGTNKKVLALFYQLQRANIPYILDLVPAYSSLAVYYDLPALKRKNPDQTAFDTMSDIINQAAPGFRETDLPGSKIFEVPVCYSSRFAPDLELFQDHRGISQEQLIGWHTERTYRVYMLGFLPGFAYMAEVDERISLPRKQTPRPLVPQGAVGIAGRQTGIYPLDSPGGWQIIGRTPLKIFDSSQEDPVLLKPGDQVKFFSISEDEFEDYQSRHS